MKLDYQEPVVIQISIKSALSDFNQGDLGWMDNVQATLLPPYPSTQELIGQYVENYLRTIGVVPYDNIAGTEDALGEISHEQELSKAISKIKGGDTKYISTYPNHSYPSDGPLYEISISLTNRTVCDTILAYLE